MAEEVFRDPGQVSLGRVLEVVKSGEFVSRAAMLCQGIETYASKHEDIVRNQSLEEAYAVGVAVMEALSLRPNPQLYAGTLGKEIVAAAVISFENTAVGVLCARHWLNSFVASDFDGSKQLQRVTGGENGGWQLYATPDLQMKSISSLDQYTVLYRSENPRVVRQMLAERLQLFQASVQ